MPLGTERGEGGQRGFRSDLVWYGLVWGKPGDVVWLCWFGGLVCVLVLLAGCELGVRVGGGAGCLFLFFYLWGMENGRGELGGRWDLFYTRV